MGRWKKQGQSKTIVSKTSNQADEIDGQPKIPGFYYDPVKRKYFKETKEYLDSLKQKEINRKFQQKVENSNKKQTKSASLYRNFYTQNQSYFRLHYQAQLQEKSYDPIPVLLRTLLTRKPTKVYDRPLYLSDFRMLSNGACLYGQRNGDISISWMKNLKMGHPSLFSSRNSEMTGICELKSFTSNTVVITNLGQEVNPGSIMLLNVNDAPPERNVPHIPLNCISRVFERNRRPVLCVAENSSIELTAYGSSGEFYVINWESPKKKQCFKIPQKTDVLSQSVLGPSGSSLLANGCRNGSIYLFDIRSQQCSTHFTTLNVRSPFTCVKPMDNDYTFVTSSLNGNIDVWDIRNSKHSLHTLASSNTIKPYRFDMYRNSIVSVSDDGWLRSWDAISGVLLIAKRLYDVVEERIFTSSHESDGQMGLCIAGKHGIDYLSCF